MTAIPEEVLNAPAHGRLLKCLHEAALIPEGVWRAYHDAVSDAYPLAQRRGDWVWITLDDDKFDKLPVTDLRRHCILQSVRIARSSPEKSEASLVPTGGASSCVKQIEQD